MAEGLEELKARVTRETHVFNAVRPVRQDINAICVRCGLVLPQGPILEFNMPVCTGPRSMHHG